MGIQDSMNRFAGNVQQSAKTSFLSALTWTVKFLTVLIIGFTIATIGQELMGFGNLAFTFVCIVVASVILRILSFWPLTSILIFDLICILIALLLRMYIVIAP